MSVFHISSCRVSFLNPTYGLLYEAPRLALDNGLAWTSNSNIIFSSLRDESLLQNNEVETHGHTYGRSYAKAGQFPIDLFTYDTETNSVKNFIEGQGPQFIPAGNKISFIRESGFFNRDLWQVNIGQKKPRLILHDIRDETAVSPSGRKYLIFVPHQQPLGSSYFLTLVDPNDQDRKLIIEPNSYYGFRWIKNK